MSKTYEDVLLISAADEKEALEAVSEGANMVDVKNPNRRVARR